MIYTLGLRRLTFPEHMEETTTRTKSELSPTGRKLEGCVDSRLVGTKRVHHILWQSNKPRLNQLKCNSAGRNQLRAVRDGKPQQWASKGRSSCQLWSERSPGEGNGNPIHILAWRSPWTEEPGGLQPMGLQRVRHDWVTNTNTQEKETKDVSNCKLEGQKVGTFLCSEITVNQIRNWIWKLLSGMFSYWKQSVCPLLLWLSGQLSISKMLFTH